MATNSGSSRAHPSASEGGHECHARVHHHRRFGVLLTVWLPTVYENLITTGARLLEEEVATHAARCVAIDLSWYQDRVDSNVLRSLCEGTVAIRRRNPEAIVAVVASEQYRDAFDMLVRQEGLEASLGRAHPDIASIFDSLSPLPEAAILPHACSARIGELSEYGTVLELELDLESQSAAARPLDQILEQEIFEHRPRGVAFDLRGYHGKIGPGHFNTIIAGASIALSFDGSSEARVLATGGVAAEIDRLLAITKMDSILGTTSGDLASAFAQKPLPAPQPLDRRAVSANEETPPSDLRREVGRASRQSCDGRPLPRRRARIPFNKRLTPDELRRVADGFVPSSMDDKWCIYLEGRWLWFHRRTGNCIFVARLVPDRSGARITEAWANDEPSEYRRADDAYEAAFLGWLIDYVLLDKDVEMPRLPDLDDPDGETEPGRGRGRSFFRRIRQWFPA